MELVFKFNTRGLQIKLSKLERQQVVKACADDMINYLRSYHVKFRDRWKGSQHMQGPNSGFFWQEVVRGWQDPVITGSTILLKNTFGLLNWKVKGGTISPVAAKELTIPLVPEAKGYSTAQYRAEEGVKLFRVGNALCKRIGKAIQGIYALKSSVYQNPWPDAMPDNATLKEVFAESAKKHIKDLASANE